MTKLESRAVLREIKPGSMVYCVTCGEKIGFRARNRKSQVIANVYVDGKWNRVEHYHAECYVEARAPYGEATKQ